MTGRPLMIVCVALSTMVGGLLWWIQRDPASELSGRPVAGHSYRGGEEWTGEPGAPGRAGGVAMTPVKRLGPDRSRQAEKTPEGPLVVADIAETARQLNAPSGSVAQDMEILQSLIDFHRRANQGEIPAGGENAEIVDQLRGKNSKQLAVIPPGIKAVDAEGRLLDRWGTPYFFHSVSRQALEIRSAGPDRKLWTEDDISNAPPAAEPESVAVVDRSEE